MGKGHLDNHRARVHRGSVAFAKKAKRRGEQAKKDEHRCNLCGTVVRVLEGGLCVRCRNRA